MLLFEAASRLQLFFPGEYVSRDLYTLRAHFFTYDAVACLAGRSLYALTGMETYVWDDAISRSLQLEPQIIRYKPPQSPLLFLPEINPHLLPRLRSQKQWVESAVNPGHVHLKEIGR